MSKTYQSNTEPKIGDTVKFGSDPEGPSFIVVAVGGGRLGNKVCIHPADEPESPVNTREYYYSCLAPVKA
jgi:hypothetical protein